MEHDHIESRLADLVTGEVATEERDMIQHHLDDCPSCREQLEALRNTMDALRREPMADVPEGYFGTVLPRLRRRIEQPRGLRRWLDLSWPQWAGPVGAAVLMVGLLMSVPLGDRQETSALVNVLGDLGASELTEVYFDELQTAPLAATMPEDLAGGILAGFDLRSDLLETMLDEHVMLDLRTVDELEEEEIGIILRRLEARTLL